MGQRVGYVSAEYTVYCDQTWSHWLVRTPETAGEDGGDGRGGAQRLTGRTRVWTVSSVWPEYFSVFFLNSLKKCLSPSLFCFKYSFTF